LKRTHLFLTLIVAGLVLSLVPTSISETPVQAQDAQPAATTVTYLPLMSIDQGMFVDRFEVEPDWWHFQLLKDDP